jgi:hypothetical protein
MNGEWFSRLTDGERIRFFISHRNYGAALSIVEGLPDRGPDIRFTIAELRYRRGDPEAALGEIERLLETRAGDAALVNRAVSFFLDDMKRVAEARIFAARSLEIRKDQPKVRALLRFLDSLQSRFHPLDR